MDEEADKLFIFYNGTSPAGLEPPPAFDRLAGARILIHPNPVDPARGTTLDVVGIDGETRIEIYSLAGRLLRLLDSGPPESEGGSSFWDGRDSQDRPLPSGACFVLARAYDGTVAARRDVVQIP